MPGGARPGAGRPKGAINRLTDEARRAAMATGVTPLEFLLETMRSEEVMLERRLDAAKAAAPYLHARLQAIQLSGPDGGPIMTQASTVLDAGLMSPEERDALRQVLEAAKARAKG